MPSASAEIPIRFDNSYAEQLADFCIPHAPTPVPRPALLRVNYGLAEPLGLGELAANSAWATWMARRSSGLCHSRRT